MNHLIKVSNQTIGGAEINSVDARGLHKFLGSKQKFTDWIKNRINDYGFAEHEDYFINLGNDNGAGLRLRTDYTISLDMAKELCMVERNDKGRQARQYFIDCEKIAKQKHMDPMAYLNDPAAMRGILLSYTEKVLALEEEKKVLTPKAEALDLISNADGMTCITDAAKTLQMRPKDLFAMLSAKRWIYRRIGGKNWIGYQDKIQQGLLNHKITTVTDVHTGKERIIENVLVTPKGIAKLSELVKKAA